jgi:hypothetical protein
VGGDLVGPQLPLDRVDFERRAGASEVVATEIPPPASRAAARQSSSSLP